MSISSRPIVSLSPCSFRHELLDLYCFGVVYEEALTTTSLVRPYLSRAPLGWQPRKAGLIDGLPIYYAAYLASRN